MKAYERQQMYAEMNCKYHAKKTEVNGIVFASKLEADRYSQLLLLEKAGEISDLKLQVEFQINQGWKDPETGQKVKSRFYVADFMYVDKDQRRIIVEDTKGVETAEFRLKWDLVKTLYPHIDFRKVTRDMV